MSDITPVSPPPEIVPGTRDYLVWYRDMARADRANVKRIRLWYEAWQKGADIKSVPQAPPDPKDRSSWPLWARKLAELAHDEDAGLGDTVARLASRVGGEQYKRLRAAIHWPCRCSQRQDQLNARYPLR